MVAAYFDQFNVVLLIAAPRFTNVSLLVLLAVVIYWGLFQGGFLIPRRWQSVLELVYHYIRAVAFENLGRVGLFYFPFLLCLFLFVLLLNFLGLFPYVFAPTAQFILTFGLSSSILLGVTLSGFLAFRLNFLSILVPSGSPFFLAPFLVLIETVGYFSRAVSLGMRLAANITAGHLLFTIISSFVYTLSSLPVLVLVFITLLELAVAVIQAYVFCLLTAIYLKDTLELHRPCSLLVELFPSKKLVAGSTPVGVPDGFSSFSLS